MNTRLDLFPITANVKENRLHIANCDLQKLAEQFGTPLYLYDAATLQEAVGRYRSALKTHYGHTASITYAGKAFLNTAMAQWVQSQGLILDCTGEGEIAIAVNAGVLRKNILVHGVNKSIVDLQAAVGFAETIVVDNLDELERLATYDLSRNSIWLRVLPGVSVSTHHAHTQTGHHHSKFGMTPAEIIEAAIFCKNHHMPLSGLHFHQGSNFRDPEPLLPAIELGLNLAKEIGFTKDWHFCPGGGWGVAYHEDELPHPSIESYVQGIAQAVIEGCAARQMNLPHLHLEPGRSLVARAGVVVYGVGAVKKRAEKHWLLIDGGLADNPRYALYKARYSCLPVINPSRVKDQLTSLAGPYCESGDIVIEDLPMPAITQGELLAVPVAGAYQLSMASNYNGARRPAVLWLEHGRVTLIQEREHPAQLFTRDKMLS